MNISGSIRKLTQLFIILFIALSAGLVYWQAVVAQQVTSNIHNGRSCLKDTAPIRGRIFDRNGVLLASSKPGGICGYQRHYTEPSLAGLIGYYISPIFGSTGIEHQYDDYLSGRKGLTELNNTLNQTLHRPPIGDDIYLTIDVRIQRIADQSFDTNAAPVDGVNTFKTKRGSVIVTDPHTGQILAMVSRPGFDPNLVAADDAAYIHQLETDPEQPLLERPIADCYTPGSTYKTLTLMAALDSHKAQLSGEPLFYNDHSPDHFQAIGPVTIGSGNNLEVFGPSGNNIEGYTPQASFPVDLNYGYTHSDNVIFAQMGAHIGVNTWLDYNSRFYVGKQIPFDLPVKASTVTPQDAQHRCSFNPQNTPLAINQLAENSFGQGVDSITPMQMSLFDNAIANNGTLMRPTLVTKIVQPSNPTNPNDKSGTTIESFNPQALGTPISSSTASQLRNAMLGVARCGSGRFSSPDPTVWTSPYAIIGKTGTGQVSNNGNPPAEAWMITQAPYQNPSLTIVAMKENGGEGGSTVGPMITHIYNSVFSSIKEWQITNPPQSSNLNVLNNQYDQYCAETRLLR